MTLPKHLRPRWRYFAVELWSWPDTSPTRDAFGDALRRSARDLLGDDGDARTELRVMSYTFEAGSGAAVVRTHRDAVEDARAAIVCLDAIAGDPIGIAIRGVSGTVRACEEKYLGRDTETSGENTVVFDGAERPATVRGADIDVRVEDAYIGATRLDLE